MEKKNLRVKDNKNLYAFALFVFAVLYQKRFKKEKESRRRLQDQLDQEHKRRSKLEEAIKTNSSNTEVLRLLSGESKFNIV